MGFSVCSILTLNDKVAGLRLKDSSGSMYDVEMGHISDESILNGFNREPLIEHGNLLVTQDELNNKYTIKDMSENKKFCESVFNYLVARKNKLSKGAKFFDVIVEIELYDPQIRGNKVHTLSAEIEAQNALKARADAKKLYSDNYSIDPKEVKIVSATLKS